MGRRRNNLALVNNFLTCLNHSLRFGQIHQYRAADVIIGQCIVLQIRNHLFAGFQINRLGRIDIAQQDRTGSMIGGNNRDGLIMVILQLFHIRNG